MEGTRGLSHTDIDPASTSKILTSLSTAIDEAHLATTLDSMSRRIEEIEATNGPTKHSRLLRKEITILEVQINFIKDRASFR